MISEKLTIVERQLLANQNLILAKLENDDNYLINADILISGYTGKYDEIFNVDFEEIPIEICNETTEILNMYRIINNAIDALTPGQKELIDLEKLNFVGFDANNDSHYHYGTFMIKRMNLWQEYKDFYFNSHSSYPLTKYRKLLAYHQSRMTQNVYELTFDDLIEMVILI